MKILIRGTMHTNANLHSVIIIGAGIAGLSAHADEYGGGIYVQGLQFGTIILTSLNTSHDSTISDNFANEGGGITFVGSGNAQSVLDMTNSTISGNTTQITGGGLEDSNRVVNLTNVTIASNRLIPVPNIRHGSKDVKKWL